MVTSRKAMRRDAALATLRAHEQDVRRLGVKSLALFGSVARDEAGADSDLDLLVEFEEPASFDRYMDVKIFLEDLLGRKVDLVTKKALKPTMRPYIERDAVVVA
jgi:predicted nucleotidyltransferase